MDWYLCKRYFPVLKELESDMLEEALTMIGEEAQEYVKTDNIYYHEYFPQAKPGVQLVTEIDKNGDQWEWENLMFHHVGYNDRQIWEMVCESKFKEFDETFHYNSADGDGMGIIRLVNRNVLGELKRGDTFKAQVCGIVIWGKIFETEKEYDDFSTGGDKDRTVLADGFLAPLDFLSNHLVYPDGGQKKDVDYSEDNLMTIKGTIKTCYKFDNRLCGIEQPTYYGVTMDTVHGKELLLIFDKSILEENERSYFAKGNVILARVLLSGDPCVGKYEKSLKKREVEKSDTEGSSES